MFVVAWLESGVVVNEPPGERASESLSCANGTPRAESFAVAA